MASNGNVLVIDDDASRAEGLAEVVSAAGYHVEIVSDVLNPNASLSITSDLDVILSELDLKGVSWGEASRTLSEMNIQAPVIMFSDTAELERMTTALRLGASDFFVRPVEDVEALCKSIDRLPHSFKRRFRGR